MSTRLGKFAAVSTAVLLVGAMGSVARAQMKEMKKPKMETISGKVIDMTCAAKGHAMMGNWHNAENNDHMTPDGKKPNCAEMCLKGGQPAALFANDKIKAVFACNPRATLADYAAKEVDVQGFYATNKKDGANTFIPQKIRAAGGGSWTDVDCATMH